MFTQEIRPSGGVMAASALQLDCPGTRPGVFHWSELALADLPTAATPERILEAIKIYILKPHVVNKRLVGVTVSADWSLQNNSTSAQEPTLNEAVLDKAKHYFGIQNLEFNDLDAVMSSAAHGTRPLRGSIAFRKLILKNCRVTDVGRFFEVIIIEMSPVRCTILPFMSCSSEGMMSLHIFDIGYQFLVPEHYSILANKSKKLILRACKFLANDGPELYSTSWLSGTLLPKILSWISSPSLPVSKNSMRHVAIDRYYQLYSQLKAKYGIAIAKVWPECTDPQKFVFEDVAIATYLMCLWQDEMKENHLEKQQSFVDLGCGNGLLVYILTQEGYPGRGIDSRRRKIWSMFGESTHLEEMSIIPSDEHLFPDCDWLIGNHSDELTPWIPVMAARCSTTTRFFLLPCCPFDFGGKYVRRDNRRSIYEDYINYVEDVATTCGFNCKRDVLRIPSTKRECIIGYSRSYAPGEYCKIDAKIRCMLDNSCLQKHGDGAQNWVTVGTSHLGNHIDGSVLCDTNATACNEDTEVALAPPIPMLSAAADKVFDANTAATSTCPRILLASGTGGDSCGSGSMSCDPAVAVQANAWNASFRPRPREEKIRNCTNIERSLQDSVVNTVFMCLLNAEIAESRLRYDGAPWNLGGCVALPVLASLFDQTTLGAMKSHCGGLQTLLRNHSHVFHVYNGQVRLRDYTSSAPQLHSFKKRKSTQAPRKFKVKACYYDSWHPAGCPLSADVCTYIHVRSIEVRNK